MIFSISKDHIELRTKSGFEIIYLWWGIDPLERARCIQFVVGRPRHKLHFEIILWRIKE